MSPPRRGRQKQSNGQSKAERGAMRHQLKSKTPSAVARLRYITRQGRYAVGLDGPRDDLRAVGNANLPGWAGGNAEVFWATADGFERANARRCLELELNLPRELSIEQQIAAVEDYIARLTAEAGPLPMTWAIHNAGDGNPHVHLMLQERPLDGHERTAEQHFKRANRANPERGGAIKSTWWHDPQHVFWSRALWADACNVALVNGGHEARFDARSKAVRLDEALRAGDLRGAALLTTVTERHEGHAVAGMRRRVDSGEVELDELPDYAQQLITHNDRARTYNCWLRDWSRTASDAELRAQLAGPLAELRERLEAESPGGHIAAWEAAQHVQALDENRERDVAAARTAGELELLAAAQIDAAEHVERDALVAIEQADHLTILLGIEREQAHAAALAENSARDVELAELIELEQADHLDNLLGIEHEQALRRQIDCARLEHRNSDLMVRHARTIIERAQGDYQRAQEALLGLPQLQQERSQAVHQASAHAAERRRLLADADAWLAAHRVRALAGMTGPADELRAKAERHAEAYRKWASHVRGLQARESEIDETARTASRALDEARNQLEGAESYADRRWRAQGGEAAALQEPQQEAERSAPELRGGDEWHDYERDGERYRHPIGRPDELYWLSPSGEWHLQPMREGDLDYGDYGGYDYP